MEINDALLQLCKSNDISNIELAYITAVESGMMSFMEFLMLLFLVRECRKTGDFTIDLRNVNHTLAENKRRIDQLRYYFTLNFTNNGNDVKFLYSPLLPNIKNYHEYNTAIKQYSINKNNLNKRITALFTEESLQGNKKGVIKFFMFLNVLEFIEKNINQYHSDFKLFIGYTQ